MQMVVITAFGVGGATVLGACLGFLFKGIPHKWNDAILGFAAGVMLCAAILGLLVPAMEMSGKWGFWKVILGMLSGALFLNFADRFTPHLHSLTGKDKEAHHQNQALNKVLLFVMAIAIHNLPEGMAAGVGFGTGNVGNAISVAVGIALQNIPEGMVVISPLLMAGVSKRRALLIGSLTGVIEVVGTFIGYFAAQISNAVLPFALAFAGGTMLYIISDEMIPETHSHGYEQMATYSILAGFMLMMVLDEFIG